MKILTRYILAELLKWFLLSLTVLTLIIMIFFVGREAMRRGMPPEGIIRLIPCFLPIALWFAVPGTLLLAATSVYGRLAGSNEVVAMKAQGISPRKILEPIWFLAFFASLVTVLLNDVAVWWGRGQVRNVIIESVEEIVYRSLATQDTYSTGALAINVKAVEGRRLICPTVTFKARGSAPAITVTAAEAEIRKPANNEDDELEFVFYRGRADLGPNSSAHFPNTSWSFFVPLREASTTGEFSDMPSHLPLRRIPEEKVKQKERLDRRTREMAARAACQMLRCDLDALTSNEWQTRANRLERDEERLHRLYAEPHRRWSSGFSCLCFVWVGAPMAIRLRNRDLLTSFFLCFLPILIVYYPLLVVGVDGAKDGRLPAWSVWAGNLLLIVWGAYLLRRVIRY